MKPVATAEHDRLRQLGSADSASAEPSEPGDSGQAMAEYALLITLVTANLVFFLPEFIDAIQRYYDSFYIILNLPIP